MSAPTDAQVVARHYLIAALWADAPEGTFPKVTKEARAVAERVATEFLAWAGGDLMAFVQAAHQEGYGAHQDCGTDRPWLAALGHDLWLTSQGHGAGFWDRDTLRKPIRDTLTALSKRFEAVYPEFYRGWLYLHAETLPHP